MQRLDPIELQEPPVPDALGPSCNLTPASELHRLDSAQLPQTPLRRKFPRCRVLASEHPSLSLFPGQARQTPSQGLNAARESHVPGRDSIHTAGRTHSRETQLAGQWVPEPLPGLVNRATGKSVKPGPNPSDIALRSCWPSVHYWVNKTLTKS